MGSKQALIALQSLFAAKDIDTKEIGHYIFSAEGRCDDLEAAAYNIVIQPGTNIAQAIALAKLLEEFAELEGVELSNPITYYVDTAEFYKDQARAAFGLPVA